LSAVVMKSYLPGVSTRKVDDLVTALSADTGISRDGTHPASCRLRYAPASPGDSRARSLNAIASARIRGSSPGSRSRDRTDIDAISSAISSGG
jgi:hypothetical protein